MPAVAPPSFPWPGALDINPSWVSGAWFTRSGSGAPVGHPLYPAERVSPSHYLTPSSRDWFSWSSR
jgi:hypothetical protein